MTIWMIRFEDGLGNALPLRSVRVGGPEQGAYEVGVQRLHTWLAQNPGQPGTVILSQAITRVED